MENIKHIGVLVHRGEDLFQGTRTALGLSVGNYYAHLFLLDQAVQMTPELQDNFAMLDDMECDYFSNDRRNEKHRFTYLPTKKLARKLKEMDIVIPFGNKLDAHSGRLPITWMLSQ